MEIVRNTRFLPTTHMQANRQAMRLSYRMANASRNMQIAVEIVRNTRFLPTITHMQTDMHYANNIGHRKSWGTQGSCPQHTCKQTGNEIKLQNGKRFAQHADCCGNREEHKVLAHYNTYANRQALRKHLFFVCPYGCSKQLSTQYSGAEQMSATRLIRQAISCSATEIPKVCILRACTRSYQRLPPK